MTFSANRITITGPDVPVDVTWRSGPGLSMSHRGLFLTLATIPVGETITLDQLLEWTAEGADEIACALAEIARRDYLTVEAKKDARGETTALRYTFVTAGLGVQK